MCATRFSYVSGIETHQAYIIRRSKNISLSLYFSYSSTISNKGRGVKLRPIRAPMRLNFSLWRPNPGN